MFIIWGWKGRPESIGNGNFFCPACQEETSYDHQQIRTWGTLFFIPVIPMAAGQRYVQCRQCQGTFVEAILNLSDRPSSFLSAPGFQPGDRVLGKRDSYWYPGTMRAPAGKKLKIQFDDGNQMILSKSRVIALDLREGDPAFARRQGGPDYQACTITAVTDGSLQVRFVDGGQEWTKLANVRVVWEEDGEQEE